jgi:hypothetical protein
MKLPQIFYYSSDGSDMEVVLVKSMECNWPWISSIISVHVHYKIFGVKFFAHIPHTHEPTNYNFVDFKNIVLESLLVPLKTVNIFHDQHNTRYIHNLGTSQRFTPRSICGLHVFTTRILIIQNVEEEKELRSLKEAGMNGMYVRRTSLATP